ncbi:hypothetical protein AWB71_06077 [Caballeronia peredens]|nr:hypothetical protein AWB71_06077 [Caballeronia peredens]
MANLDSTALGLAMDAALDALLRADGKPGLPGAPPEQVQDRQRFFIAIATGVIEHLRANPDAFRIAVGGAPGLTATMTAIKRTGDGP